MLNKTAVLALVMSFFWGAASLFPRPAPSGSSAARNETAEQTTNTTRRSLLYRVRRGDTLYSIARRYGVSVSEIRSWNHLRSSRIIPGTLLRVHPGSRRRVVSHRRHFWSPWRVSSYGDSGADDDTAGDDPQIRAAALQALGRWNGSVLVVDPNTGRILTLVNQKLALESGFIPCSTFKPVVALGALKEGVITPSTKLYVGRRTRLDLTEALAHSNNRFFALLGEKLGYARLAHFGHEFGLGEKAGWEIPGESAGVFPSEPPRDGGVGKMSSFGEGLEVTPLQMAAIASAFANGGTLYYLQYPQTPEERANFHPRIKHRLQDLSEYFPYVRRGMAAAVLYGTARSAYDPQEQIFGKTGTCSEDGARLGWFVSYANGVQPKYVVVVLLRGGRPMFGPHAAKIAGRLYRDLRLRDQNAMRAESSSGPETSETR